MIKDILHFNKVVSGADLDETMSLKQLLDELGVGAYFRERYLYPLAGAIWSTTRADMERFPAKSFVRFFENHGLLSATKGPKWRTVSGGSRVYVEKLVAELKSRGVSVKADTKIEAVSRATKPWVKAEDDVAKSYDRVIFACHSNEALELLQDASEQEQSVLGALRYRPNRVYLHGDVAQMPKRRAAWSSWVFKGRSDEVETDGSFTYWMNSLQHIPEDNQVFVTLNPEHEIPDNLIYDESTLYHPQFDIGALEAQTLMDTIQGNQSAWFCGAYTRYGFHEDGLMSGLAVAKSILEPAAKVEA
jgi:predicted NAD/FAD-binding protein